MANEFKIKNGLIVNGNMSASGTIIANTLTALSIIITGSLVGTPEMYGAVGDGITDDQLSFKHALISHSLVELSAKTYAIRGFLGMPSYRTLRGKGKDKTIIKVMDNSPYGYGHTLTVIQNTFFQDTIYWFGSTIGTSVGSGSVDVDHRDTAIVDKAIGSPLYNQSQTQDWAGLGYWSYDTDNGGLVGARKNVIIEDLTIDCNFNNQAKHSSWNHANNPSSASNGGGGHYVPRYSWKVRPTVHAIELSGENIVVNNVKVINYGYGVGYAAAAPLDHANSATYPVYVENFPILLGGNNNLNYTSSNTNDLITDGVGDSKFKGNYVLNSEVLDIANVDLMNPFSNTTAIYVTNQSVALPTGRSTFSSEGGIYNCTVNPGDNYKPTVGAFFAGSYLDEHESSSLKQSAPSLIEWLSAGGSSTGSNGDYAILNGPMAGGNLAKKISGSWYYAGAAYVTQQHYVQAYSGYRVFNSTAKHISIGFYLDSWRNNAYVENNQFIDVDSGFRSVVSDISLTSSYNNVVIKNNYVKLARQDHKYIYGHATIFYGADRATSNGSILRHIDNLVIENNIFELPISSSKSIYHYPPYVAREYPRYIGLWIPSEVNPSGSQPNLHRSVSIKNNNFVNWNPVKSELITGGEAYGYNVPFFFTYHTSSVDFDTSDNPAGPYPNSLTKFKNITLSKYIIEGNIYNDSIYPSTSSLVPITFHMVGTGNQYYYPVDQVSRLGSVTATTLANGSQVLSSGNYSHAEGSLTTASGDYSHAEGIQTKATGQGANSKGGGTLSSGAGAHSEGIYTTASANYSHAEGHLTVAATQLSHAEGSGSWAGYSSFTGLPGGTGVASHAEGLFTRTSGVGSHSEGSGSIAEGVASHAEGQSTIASGIASHAEGYNTTASADYQHVSGKFNVTSSNTNDLFIIGNGTSAARSNILAVNTSSVTIGEYSGINKHASLRVKNGLNDNNTYHLAQFLTSVSGSNLNDTQINSTYHSSTPFIIAGTGSADLNMAITLGGTRRAVQHTQPTAELNFHNFDDNSKSLSASVMAGIGAYASSATLGARGGNLAFYTVQANATNTQGKDTAMVLTSVGLGIAVDAPSEKLTVNGNITASGFVSASTIRATTSMTSPSGNFTNLTSSDVIISNKLNNGSNNIITSGFGHAEGFYTRTAGFGAHSEGYLTTASGDYSHAEGEINQSSGQSSHAEGVYTITSGSYSHAEGHNTITKGWGSHAEGYYTVTGDSFSHAEGQQTYASGSGAHAEGYFTTASGQYSHAEGFRTTASGQYSHAEGRDTHASGSNSHAEGSASFASGITSHAEGKQTHASGSDSHAEGFVTIARGSFSHAEGYSTVAYNTAAHAEGSQTHASGSDSHSEGYETSASGEYSHAEGYNTTARGKGSHVEGSYTFATGSHSHAEGYYTSASGDYSHAEGQKTYAFGISSHAEGSSSLASGFASHAEGLSTTASADYQHVSGKFNVTSSNTNNLFIIGNGTSNISRSNVLVVDTGSVTVGGYGNLILAPDIFHNYGEGGQLTLCDSQSRTTYMIDEYKDTGKSESLLRISSDGHRETTPTSRVTLRQGSIALSVAIQDYDVADDSNTYSTFIQTPLYISSSRHIFTSNYSNLGLGMVDVFRENSVTPSERLTVSGNISASGRILVDNGGFTLNAGFNTVSRSALLVNTNVSHVDRTYYTASATIAGGLTIVNGILLVTGSEANTGSNKGAAINIKGAADAPFLSLCSKDVGSAAVEKYGLVHSSGKRLWLSAGESPGILCVGDATDAYGVSIGTTPQLSCSLNVGSGVGTFALRVEGGITSSGQISASTIRGTTSITSPIGSFTNLTASNIYSSGNVGIGTTSLGFPLNFAGVLGDKISLWGESGNHYGFGIQGSLLQIHCDTSGADIAFGYGTSAAMTETMRIKGNGYVGIGTTTPNEKLTVVGNISASGAISSSTIRAVTSMTSPIGNFTNLTASNVSASGYVSASSVTAANFYGTATSATSATSASYALTASFATTAGTATSATSATSATTATTATTANSLTLANSYNITNLTASNISASGNVSASTIRAVTSMTSPSGNFTNLTASNIYSSGIVGIGTTSPANTLHVFSSAAPARFEMAGSFNVNLASSANLPYWQFLNSANNAVVASGLDAASLNLGRGNVRIIGVDTPATAPIPSRLYVVGDGTNPAAIFNTGNVGIGTSAPGTRLQASGTIRSTGMGPTPPNSGDEVFGAEVFYNDGVGYFLSFDRTDNDPLESHFGGSGVSGIRVATSGYVGIGTTTPSERLTVVGNISASGAISSSTIRAVTSMTSPSGNFTNLTASNIYSSGNVGIGTDSPGTKLDTTGTIRTTGITAGNATAGSGAEIAYDGVSVGYFITYNRNGSGATLSSHFGGDGATGIRVDTLGKVGIGTTSPNEKLTVQGNISASGAISSSTIRAVTSMTSPSGNFTNLTASNISASGFVSASSVTAANGIYASSFTSSLTSAVGYSGYMPSEFMVAVSDEISNIASGSNKLRFIFPFTLTGSTLTAYVHTAPVGSQITCSARIGGNTISASIGTSAKSGSASSTYYITKYQEVLVDINQVGSSTAGQGLKLIFEGMRKI